MPSAKELAKALAYQGEIRNTPQNSFLGAIANFLAPVSEFADRDKLPGSIPLLGGMSFADLSGLKGSQSLIEDMSYGKSPVRGATLNTVKVDPRLLDVAAVSGAMIPVGKALGKAALKKAAEQVQNRTGIARYMPDTRMSAVPEGASMPQRPKLQVKPPKEDIYSVADANFSMGIPSGNKTVKIGTLQGSMSSAAGDAERVKKLAGQMSADGGYIERLIVDQNGNVIEGQHRLNALRSLGVTDIPVSVIQDASPTYDLLMKSGKLRSEHARQIVRDSADMLKSEGGDVSAVLSGYDLPKGYEQYFMDAVNDLSKPKAKAMSAPDNVGGAMMQRPKTEFEILHDTAQRNAALPKEQGGLGLPSGNSYMDRAGAMGAVDYLHGTQRLDRLLSGKNLDPKRATSGPMPFGTDTPPVASSYAMNKQDTSRMASNTGDLAESFQVSPKSLGLRGKNPYTVEQSWNLLSPEVKADILDKSRRIGYENPAQGEGAWTLHPTSQGAPFSPSHFDYELKAAKGNPLAALRSAYGESGMLDAYAPSELADIYKLAGYPHEISQANAPWTSAQGVLTGKAMINNPLKTSNVEEIRSTVIPALKEAFAKDKTRLKTSGSDEWAKDARYTPKEWVNQLEQDLAKGDNSYVWTSIPDKVTDQIKKLGYQGIIDTGGKGGDLYGHQVVIPFQPSQVRSRFAAFDPFRRHEADILAGVGVGGMLDPQAIAEALRQQDRK